MHPVSYSKAYKFLTLRNLILLCFVFSMVVTVISIFGGFAALSSYAMIPVAMGLGSMAFFAYLIRMASPLIHSEFLEGVRMDVFKWASLVYNDIDHFVFGKDYVAWVIKGKKSIEGAKVFVVADVPYTMKEMSRAEFEARVRTYAVTMTAGDVRLGTFHMRLPIDKASFISAIRRQRDSYQTSFDVGGPPSHLEEAAKRTAMIKRIEEQLEEAYEARFFIFVAAEADTKEELEKLLQAHGANVKNRFQMDIGVIVQELKDLDLLEALRFFRAPALMDYSASTSKTPKIPVLSLDLAFQNPLVTPRLPPLYKMMYGVFLGVTKGTQAIPVTWSPLSTNMPNYHFTGLGPPGTGKSTLARTLMYRIYLQMGVPFWMIDPAGEHAEIVRNLGGRVVDMHDDSVNPFTLYGSDPMSVANDVAQLTIYTAGLRGAELYVLRRAILDVYKGYGIDEAKKETWSDEASNKVTFEGVYNYLVANLENFPPDERPLAKSIISRLEIYARGAYKIRSATFNFDDLYKGKRPVCFNVRGLPDYLQRAIVWTILSQMENLLYHRYGITEDLRLIIMVDEAHLFSQAVKADVPGGVLEPPLSRFVRMTRKSGVGFWCLTHNHSDLPRILFEGVSTFFFFGSHDPNYLDWCAHQLNLTEEQIRGPEGMMFMGKGEGMLRLYGDPRCIPLKIVAEEEALTTSIERETDQKEEGKESMTDWIKRLVA